MNQPADGSGGRSDTFCLYLSLPCCSWSFMLGISVAGTEAVNRTDHFEAGLGAGGIRTYAMTGQYPQSLDELLNDYHITYDSDKFVVEYVPNSSNLLPSISVLILSSQKGGPS